MEIAKLSKDQKQERFIPWEYTSKSGVPNEVIQRHDNSQNPIYFMTKS